MALFSKKKNVEEIIVDDWMREDYIVVDNNINPKDLKPYQRLIVLRKPTGEQKCVVDVSLPYEELNKLKQQVNSQGYANILDDEITRIIPSEYEYSKYYDHKITLEEADNISNMFSANNDKEFDEINLQNVLPEKPEASIIALKDDSINISLVPSQKEEIELEPGVDDIDNIEIIIPSEERNAGWDDVENIFNDGLENELSESVEQPENIEVIEENVENLQDQENISDDLPLNVDDHETQEINLEQEQSVELVNPESNYTDYHEEQLPKQEEPVYSFFKNKVALEKYEQQKQQRNVYSFYKVPYAANNPVRKIMLNRKAKMFTYRRKVDKRLINVKNEMKQKQSLEQQ